MREYMKLGERLKYLSVEALGDDMDINEKRLFVKQIKLFDPKEEYVKIDLDRQEIHYSDEIKQHRKISKLTKEEVVRAFVVVKLIAQLGYAPDCIELEKEHTIGRRTKKTSARIDVLVKNKDESYSTFMIIEVKAPDEYDRELEEIKTQLFEVAKLEKGTQYLIYYTAYATEKRELQERIVSISFGIYDSYKDWEKDGKPNLMGIPKEYGLIKKPIFTKKGVPDLRTDATTTQLESIRRELHDVLWGGGRYQGNEIFQFIMKLFLAKIYDEKETEDRKAYQFQIYFENGKSETPDKLHKRINEIYQKALVKYLYIDSTVAKERDLASIGEKKTIDKKKIKYIVEKFQDISLTNNIHDILGDFFERFLWGEFKQNKGQFFTHPNIVKFIIYSLDLGELAISKINTENKLPYLIDPTCGSGTFLIEAMKEITKCVINGKGKLKQSDMVKELLESEFPPSKKYRWAEKYMYGMDFNEDLALATKVNMVMHGDGSVNIESEDALSEFSRFTSNILKKSKPSDVYERKVNEQFDVIITNPPFSIELEKYTKEELPDLFIYGNKENSENLFVERWYQLLKPNGRLGAVLPESFFDTKENLYIRLFLYKHFWIKAIVSLPYLTFEPYTLTKTSLLFAQKKTQDDIAEYDKIWKKYAIEFEQLDKDMRKLIISIEDSQKGLEPIEDKRKQLVVMLKNYIREEFEDGDEKLSYEDLKSKYSDFINKTPFRIDANWWIFSKVSEELDYDIFMANVEEVGYKRTTRWEKERPNDLFATSKVENEETVSINTKEPKTVLDNLRGMVKWE